MASLSRHITHLVWLTFPCITALKFLISILHSFWVFMYVPKTTASPPSDWRWVHLWFHQADVGMGDPGGEIARSLSDPFSYAVHGCVGEAVSIMEQNILELRLRAVPGTWWALCWCSPCSLHPAVLVLLGASLSRRGSRLYVFSSPCLAAGKWQSWDSSSVWSDAWAQVVTISFLPY